MRLNHVKEAAHKDAMRFLQRLKPDIRKALLLNKRWIDVELKESGYSGVYDAYYRTVFDKLDFSLSEAIIILTEVSYELSECLTVGDESQTDATRRHAAIVYGNHVMTVAGEKYAAMWQEWLNGGDIDRIVDEVREAAGYPAIPETTEQR